MDDINMIYNIFPVIITGRKTLCRSNTSKSVKSLINSKVVGDSSIKSNK